MKLGVFIGESTLGEIVGSSIPTACEDAGGRVRRRRVRRSQWAVVAEVAGSADSIGTNVNGCELVTGLDARLPEHAMTGGLVEDAVRLGRSAVGQAMTPSVQREPA